MTLPYSQEKFVGRDGELADVQNNWIPDPRSEVLIILGPPRTGKSWFVARLFDILRNSGHHNPLAPVFSVAISDLVIENPPQIGQCTVGEHQYTAWVQQFITVYQPDIPTIPVYDPTMELLASVEALAEALAQQFGDAPVYLLIDDGDLLTERYWRDFEKKIIEPFHSVPDSHFRFVVALRDDVVRLAGMRRKKLPITPWADNEGDRQLERLLADHKGWTVNRLRRKLPGYSWLHPGLNGYLYDKFVVRRTRRVSPNTLLNEGLRDILHATPDNHTGDEIRGWLRSLALSGRFWNFADLEELWKDEPSVEVARRIDVLLNHWLFVAVGTNGDRWRLPPGVASYVRACR